MSILFTFPQAHTFFQVPFGKWRDGPVAGQERHAEWSGVACCHCCNTPRQRGRRAGKGVAFLPERLPVPASRFYHLNKATLWCLSTCADSAWLTQHHRSRLTAPALTNLFLAPADADSLRSNKVVREFPQSRGTARWGGFVSHNSKCFQSSGTNKSSFPNKQTVWYF